MIQNNKDWNSIGCCQSHQRLLARTNDPKQQGLKPWAAKVEPEHAYGPNQWSKTTRIETWEQAPQANAGNVPEPMIQNNKDWNKLLKRKRWLVGQPEPMIQNNKDWNEQSRLQRQAELRARTNDPKQQGLKRVSANGCGVFHGHKPEPMIQNNKDWNIIVSNLA